MASLAVFGPGYVGSATAACFASRGHQVIGVDNNRQNLDLLRQGVDLTVFDRTVEPEYPTGRNKQFLDMTMPHIMRHMLGSLPEAIHEAEVFVICSHDKEAEGVLLAAGKEKGITDLVGLPGLKHSRHGYSGIAW